MKPSPRTNRLRTLLLLLALYSLLQLRAPVLFSSRFIKALDHYASSSSSAGTAWLLDLPSVRGGGGGYAAAAVRYNLSAAPPCALAAVVVLYPSTNSTTAAARRQTTCHGLLLRDDLVLTSRWCAERTVAVAAAGGPGLPPGITRPARAASVTPSPPMEPLAFVEVELPPHAHHRQSGFPRKRLFLSSRSRRTTATTTNATTDAADLENADRTGLRCRSVPPQRDGTGLRQLHKRPVAWAVPLDDGRLVPVGSLGSALPPDLLWEETDIISAPELQSNDAGTTDDVWWVKWRPVEDLDRRHEWMNRYVGRPGSLFIHDWSDPGALLEAEDPSPAGHRIHYCLKRHFLLWRYAKPFSGEPFFEWLDYGTGHRFVDSLRRIRFPELREREWEHAQDCAVDLDRRHTRFLAEGEKKDYVVNLERHRDGVRLTYNESGLPVPEGGHYSLLFVWDISKTFYVVVENRRVPNRMSHTSVTSGGPLFCAGELEVGKDGKLRLLQFSSGHYKPKFQHFLLLFKWFQKLGLDVHSFEWERREEFPSDRWKELFAVKNR